MTVLVVIKIKQISLGSLILVPSHGIPDVRPLVAGDIVSIDISCFVDGVHGDCCGTFIVEPSDAAAGNGAGGSGTTTIPRETRHLVEFARSVTAEAVALCAPGVPLQHIGALIQKRCNAGGFGNVDAFTGHGIGAEFHTYPSIYHFGDHFEGRDDVGVTMQPGMVFTIEPIVVHLNARGRAPSFRTLSDAWTIVANEPLLSAQVLCDIPVWNMTFES